MTKTCALGFDFGTSSVRALIVRLSDGSELARASVDYPSGRDGVLLDPSDPHFARQAPRDYRSCLAECGKQVLQAAEAQSGFRREQVIGIGVDTTGSTPLPVDAELHPLALQEAFRAEPAAAAWLWKDHTAFAEAREITERAREMERPFLSHCGGTYSSEWYWSKILHAVRTAPAVAEAAHLWLELCDWIPAELCGLTRVEELKPSVCAAGHKGLYSTEWGGWPDADFLHELDPYLAELRERLPKRAFPIGEPAGRLSATWQAELGLPEIPVSVGALDAHLGAVGSGVRPGTLVKILGTSTCDILVSGEEPVPTDIPGVCGAVEGSVLPLRVGIEAGQSAVGDLFRWWADTVMGHDDQQALTEAAARLEPGQSGLVALDWNNGNRCVLTDPELTGLVVGQTLGTTAPEIYRALIEATAFGARKILQQVDEYGVTIESVVVCGGIAGKNPFLLQTYADVLARPIEIAGSSESCALGAAIGGAVAAGAGAFESLQQELVPETIARYEPNAVAIPIYDRLYKIYLELHDAFGRAPSDEKLAPDLSEIMKELLTLRRMTTTPTTAQSAAS